MSTLELRRLAKSNIDALPAERLPSVIDFLGYLRSSPATAARPSFAARMALAEDDVASGKLISVGKLKRK